MNDGTPDIPSVFDNVDFTPKFKHFTDTKRDINLAWRDVTLTIKNKQILKPNSGSVRAGEVCALMGPSGAGKSSLLNVLAGRIIPSKKKNVGGKVYVNGREINPREFQSNIAYVMQEDLVFASATAREAIELSAKLRLPAVVSRDRAKIKTIVDDLLESLGLVEVQHTLVGSERLRGLSGGEKKRVAIGVELVTNPSFLFLDEPTSGLDSVAAWKVIRVLKALGDSTGCAILCTIHQPSSEIFSEFHKVMMLTQGQIMYNGPVKDVPETFSTLGKPIPIHSNPADFILVVAQTTKVEEIPKFNVDANKEIKAPEKSGKLLMKRNFKKIGPFSQALLLSKREVLSLKRDYVTTLVLACISLFLASLYGTVFFQTANRDEDDFQFVDATGVLILATMVTFFSAVQSQVLTFPLERGIFLRELRTGSYSPFSYFVSKLLVEIPKSLIVPVISFTVTYFTLGFEGNLGVFIAVGWLLHLSTASFAVLVGSMTSHVERAMQASTIIFVPQLLFSGIFASLTAIPPFLQWFQYVCVFKYAVNLIFIEEFNDCDFSIEEEERLPGLTDNCTRFFESNDIDSDFIYRDFLVMILIFVVLRTLAMILLSYQANNFE